MSMDRRKKNIVELTRTTVEEYAEAPKMPLTLLLDNVRSMQNVGSLLRTSDAFAVAEVVMTGITGFPPHPEISKSALGAEDSVKWRYAEDSVEECRRLCEAASRSGRQLSLCVLEQTHGSVPLQEFRPLENTHYLLVVGNEVEGVAQDIVDMADVCLEIPQCGVKHSLNVSVSGAIALWHFFSALRL